MAYRLGSVEGREDDRSYQVVRPHSFWKDMTIGVITWIEIRRIFSSVDHPQVQKGCLDSDCPSTGITSRQQAVEPEPVAQSDAST